MKSKFEILLFYIFKIIIIILPVKLRYVFADLIGLAFFKFVKKRREITFKNLDIAFPEKTKEEKLEIAKASYKNMSKNFVELFWIGKILKGKKINIVNGKLLKTEYDKGKGVILLSLHLGNWECGTYLSSLGYKIAYVAKRQRNRAFDEIINRARVSNGGEIIFKGDSPKKLISTLKNHNILSLLSDQYIKDVKINFFNKKTYAPSGAALLSLKYDVPVLLVYMIRNKDNSIDVIIDKKVETKKTGNLKQDIKENTQNFTLEIENIIKKHPKQWFWQHNRWKD